jgi:hypothetical protein
MLLGGLSNIICSLDITSRRCGQNSSVYGQIGNGDRGYVDLLGIRLGSDEFSLRSLITTFVCSFTGYALDAPHVALLASSGLTCQNFGAVATPFHMFFPQTPGDRSLFLGLWGFAP